MDPRHDFGRKAETAAIGWFQKEHPGAKLLARNVRYRFGELDLVFELPVQVGPLGCFELVFVEVRARGQVGGRKGWVRGLESVTIPKQRRLVRAIGAYLARYQGRAQGVRVDILSLDHGEWQHARNVFLKGA